MRHALLLWVVGPVLLALGSAAGADPERAPRAPDLRLVPLLDGLREAAPGGDLARISETEAGKHAAKVSLDLTKPENPLLAAARASARVFYVFHMTTENAFGDRPWILQRIRKTERTWATPEQEKPDEKVTWQVEAFKLVGGRVKRSDQHYGSFGLHDAFRREIVKEFEIGFGEIPGVSEGRAWPFGTDSLYRMIQPWKEEAGHHAATRFAAARRWTLSVTIERGGAWRVASPELGFDAPSKWPDPAIATPPPDPTSADVVLLPGKGVLGLEIGKSTAADLVKTLGEPLEDVDAGKGHRLMSFARSLTCNLDPDGFLKTVITRPGFAGKTKQGLALGTTRAKVMEVMGVPKGQKADAEDWSYPGLVVWFDALDKVVRLVLARAP